MHEPNVGSAFPRTPPIDRSRLFRRPLGYAPRAMGSRVAPVFVLFLGCVQIRPATADGTSGEETTPDAGTRAPKDAFSAAAFRPRIDAVVAKGDSDPAGAARELSDLRVEMYAAWLRAHGRDVSPSKPSNAPEHPFRRNWGEDQATTVPNLVAGTDLPDDKELRRILRNLQQERARLLGKAARKDDLIRELAPTNTHSADWMAVAMRKGSMPVVACRLEDPPTSTCRQAFDAFEKVAPKACFNTNREESVCYMNSATLIADRVNPYNEGAAGFVDTIVFGVEALPNGGYRVRGDGWDPHDSRECVGEFQTDKIVSVTDSTIWVERTTWCQQIKKHKESGINVVITLSPGLPIAPRAGDTLLMFVKPADVSHQTAGRVKTITIKNPLVVELSVPEGIRFARGVVLDWQFGEVTKVAR